MKRIIPNMPLPVARQSPASWPGSPQAATASYLSEPRALAKAEDISSNGQKTC